MRTQILLAWFLLLAVRPLFTQNLPTPPAQYTNTAQAASRIETTPKEPTPTVFQADEGDRWMLMGLKPLIFKVDPVTTGSDTLVVGTEEMPPGNKIPAMPGFGERFIDQVFGR